jgi:GNAT superfamily N-acetyltransferase
MSWVDQSSSALLRHAVTPTADERLNLHVQWLATISPEDVAQLRHLMENAYSTPSMWHYYRDVISGKDAILLFTLRLRNTEEIIATRSVGEAPWGDEYWNRHAPFVGQDVPIGEMAVTVKREYRGQAVGKLLWQETTDWLRRYSGIGVVFGDTNSRRAIDMYRKRGAWFFENDVKALCDFYQVKDMSALLVKTTSLERLNTDYVLRYAWPFSDAYHISLQALGYRQIL